MDALRAIRSALIGLIADMRNIVAEGLTASEADTTLAQTAVPTVARAEVLEERRHLDQPGVLAGVLDAISAAHINVQEMENIIFEGAQAAVARIHLETQPDETLLQKIRGSSRHILEIALIQQSRNHHQA